MAAPDGVPESSAEGVATGDLRSRRRARKKVRHEETARPALAPDDGERWRTDRPERHAASRRFYPRAAGSLGGD